MRTLLLLLIVIISVYGKMDCDRLTNSIGQRVACGIVMSKWSSSINSSNCLNDTSESIYWYGRAFGHLNSNNLSLYHQGLVNLAYGLIETAYVISQCPGNVTANLYMMTYFTARDIQNIKVTSINQTMLRGHNISTQIRTLLKYWLWQNYVHYGRVLGELVYLDFP